MAPLTSLSELQALYTSGIVDYESCLPTALHSLGCSAEEIAAALERRRAIEKEESTLQAVQTKTDVAELQARERAARADAAPPSKAPKKKAARTVPEKPKAASDDSE